MLMHHNLCFIYRDNVLSLGRAALIDRIIVGYEIDVGYFIMREIRDQVMGTKIVMLFPCLLTWLFWMREC